MTRQIVLRKPLSMVDRRQPLLADIDGSSRGGIRRQMSMGELAGGATAECAAVACCCPCGLLNIIVLAVYKVPAGLCRKALRDKRRRRLMSTKKEPYPARKCGCDDLEFQIHSMGGPLSMVSGIEMGPIYEDDKDVIELEKEMWDQFYGTGFWRSSSQRSEISSLSK